MLAAGSRLGRYEILGLLGAGGMGEVYRARDPELGREVALKVLPEDVAREPERLRRFRFEARAAGSLNHPNIVSVHDVGSDRDRPFLVSELVEGDTLRERLSEGPLPPRAALNVAVQMARGLAAAHDGGVVHRDLKPENVCLCGDETVKILDFGLARLTEPKTTGPESVPTLTAPGTLLGTAAYMSPEQARGDPADERSDLFSFGAIVYETLSGRRAFPGDSVAEVLVGVLNDEPPSLTEPSGRLAPGLERIARRCLHKDPESRFQSARDVVFALEAVIGEENVLAESPAGRSTNRPALAVLLFQDLSGGGDNEHLCVGLADTIVAELASLQGLIVRPTSAVLRYRDRRLSPPEAGRELDVDVVLEGSFQRLGNRLRVAAQLVSVAESRPLWAAKIDSSLEELFELQDTVAGEVAEALALELVHSRAAPDGDRPDVPARAYESYLEGKFHLQREALPDVRAAVEALERACEAAPRFTAAWVGLGEACLRMAWTFEPEGGWYERAEEASREALAVDPELPEALYLHARIRWSPRHGFDHEEGMRSLHRAAQARPSFHHAHHYLAHVLFHVGLLEEASAALERALDIDPEDLVVSGHLGFNRFLEGRFHEGLRISESASERSPTAWSRYCEAICHLRLGDVDAARAAAATISRHFSDSVWIDSLDGLFAALDGDRESARAAVDRIAANEKAFGHFHHAQHDVAVILAQIGDFDAAVEWLSAAADNGFPCAPAFEADPLMAPLRGEVGYESLMERLHRDGRRYRQLYEELVSPPRAG